MNCLTADSDDSFGCGDFFFGFGFFTVQQGIIGAAAGRLGLAVFIAYPRSQQHRRLLPGPLSILLAAVPNAPTECPE